MIDVWEIWYSRCCFCRCALRCWFERSLNAFIHQLDNLCHLLNRLVTFKSFQCKVFLFGKTNDYSKLYLYQNKSMGSVATDYIQPIFCSALFMRIRWWMNGKVPTEDARIYRQTITWGLINTTGWCFFTWLLANNLLQYGAGKACWSSMSLIYIPSVVLLPRNPSSDRQCRAFSSGDATFNAKHLASCQTPVIHGFQTCEQLSFRLRCSSNMGTSGLIC